MGSRVMSLLVKDLMSSPVVSLDAAQPLPVVEDIMTFRHVRHLPVIDAIGKIVGIVTHRDLLRAQISSLVGLTSDERRERQADVPASSIMTANVWTVRPDMPAVIAARLLHDHQFGCLPVVDEGGHLVGMLTERDFLRLAVQHLETVAVAEVAKAAEAVA